MCNSSKQNLNGDLKQRVQHFNNWSNFFFKIKYICLTLRQLKYKSVSFKGSNIKAPHFLQVF